MESSADVALRNRLAGLTRDGGRELADLEELEAVILHATSTADDRLEFDARIHWIWVSAAHHRPTEMRIANLTWCLHWIDEHPGLADRRAQSLCLRESARRIQQIALDPSVSIGEIRRLLHTYRQHRIRGGFSEHAEHALRVKIAWALGDGAEAAYQWALHLEAYPDDLAPCPGCSTADEILLLAGAERWHRAAELALAHFDGTPAPTCSDHPFTVQAVSLMALSLTGHHDVAERVSDEAWTALMRRPDHPVAAGMIVQWMAWSGDATGAASRIGEYLPHLDGERGSIPGYRQTFAAAVAYTMRLLVDEGLCHSSVLGSTPAELATIWGADCRERSRRFDARNRTTTGTRSFEKLFATAPWRGQVVGPDRAMPLEPGIRTGSTASPGTPVRPVATSSRSRTALSSIDAPVRRPDAVPLTVGRALRTVRWWSARE